MTEKHLSNDEFFSRLAELFDSRSKESHGSVFMTQKRLSPSDTSETLPDAGADPFPDLHPANPLPVIVRATDGKSADKHKNRTKISTVVQPDAIEGFYARYADICKAGMQGLRKRDRKGRKKDKAKKKKGATAGADAEKKS